MVGPTVLIVGATGKQGFATIEALDSMQRNAPRAHILGLTRSSTSSKAQALKQRFPGVDLVEGDVTKPQLIFDSHPRISSIFLVTVPPNDEQQAIPMIDTAIAKGTSHIVFSSVDRGGESHSWTNPTTVPHFAAKHRVELHLREATQGTRTQWTILRPAGFMDNYSPDLFGKVMGGLWATMATEKKMQLVCVQDIGRIAAHALLDVAKWNGRAVGIAGDELTFGEADVIFQRVMGYRMPRTWDVVGRLLRWGVDDAAKSMDWFEKVGFGVDIEGLREEGFEVLSFERWLEQSTDRG